MPAASSVPNGARRTRPGGRSAKARAAVLAASRDQLLARGYHRFSVRDVSVDTGVAETTIYRHWPTKTSLVAAVLLELADTDNPQPDTGTLEGDLRAILSGMAAILRRDNVADVLRAVIPLSATDFEPVRDMFWGTRLSEAEAIVHRAIARGELPADTDPGQLIEFLTGPSYLRLLLRRAPLDNDLIEYSVHRTIRAFSAPEQP
jgi:AcrR family transcriptional regulator